MGSWVVFPFRPGLWPEFRRAKPRSSEKLGSGRRRSRRRRNKKFVVRLKVLKVAGDLSCRLALRTSGRRGAQDQCDRWPSLPAVSANSHFYTRPAGRVGRLRSPVPTRRWVHPRTLCHGRTVGRFIVAEPFDDAARSLGCSATNMLTIVRTCTMIFRASEKSFKRRFFITVSNLKKIGQSVREEARQGRKVCWPVQGGRQPPRRLFQRLATDRKISAISMYWTATDPLWATVPIT